MSTIEVLSRTQRIIVESPSSIRIVSAGPVGPQGAKGDTGDPGPKGDKGDQGDPGTGGAGTYFVHVQTTPASTWTFNHGLGMFPAVTITDDSGVVGQAAVQYIDANNISVSFSIPFTGKAYCS